MRDKFVFISGSSSGIGKEIAFKFAKAGAHLILTYNRRKEEGMEVVDRCRHLKAGRAILLHLDVMDDGSILEAAKMVQTQFGHINILVNNAGMSITKDLADQTFSEIETQIRTNFEGMIKLTHTFLPLVKELIINIGSRLAKNPMPRMTTYCATKFAVRGFTQALALEVPSLKIFCVNPDLTSTPNTSFQGRPPEVVADVVIKGATGELHVEQGGDLDVRELVQ